MRKAISRFVLRMTSRPKLMTPFFSLMACNAAWTRGRDINCSMTCSLDNWSRFGWNTGRKLCGYTVKTGVVIWWEKVAGCNFLTVLRMAQEFFVSLFLLYVYLGRLMKSLNSVCVFACLCMCLCACALILKLNFDCISKIILFIFVFVCRRIWRAWKIIVTHLLRPRSNLQNWQTLCKFMLTFWRISR